MQSDTVVKQDQEFKASFEQNLAKIRNVQTTLSGKQGVDPQAAAKFVQLQTSPYRRELAQLLIDNVVYVTMDDTVQVLHELMDKLYLERLSGYTGPVYFYSGEPSKSFFFLNVLALEYINQKQYMVPTFVRELSTVVGLVEDAPIVMLDDFSYSGTQMANMIQLMYDNTIKKNIPLNLIPIVTGMTTKAQKKLSEVIVDKIDRGIYSLDTPGPSPFKVLCLERTLVPVLVDIIGLEKFFQLLILFSPFTCTVGHPVSAVYLDYKVADESSTFTETFTFGAVPPSDYLFSNSYFMQNELFLSSQPHFAKYVPKGVSTKSLLAKFFQVLLLKDVCDSPNRAHKTLFSPFIQSCNQKADLQQAINKLSNAGYNFIMLPRKILYDYENAVKELEFEALVGTFLYTSDAGAEQEKKIQEVIETAKAFGRKMPSVLQGLNLDDEQLAARLLQNVNLEDVPPPLANPRDFFTAKGAEIVVPEKVKAINDQLIELSKMKDKIVCPAPFYKSGPNAMTLTAAPTSGGRRCRRTRRRVCRVTRRRKLSRRRGRRNSKRSMR